ncbi:PepSY-associated TM helix domain-containing protein [Fibrella aestuarina]|nr:PepSY-associated TM helix domain-containing protein [Fibrella aestuarina]
MTPTDKLIYKFHRIFGLVGGLFILMLSLTGCILLFDNAIDGLLNPDTVAVQPGPQRQPYDKAIATLKQHYPDAQLRNLVLYSSQPNRALRADVQKGKQRLWAYVNPYTGTFLGERDAERAFVRQVRQLHEHLLMPPVGDWILFVVGLCLVGSVLTGTWYYRKSLLSVFKIGVRWNKPKRLVYGDLHKYLGVVALLFLLIIGATGTFFHWEHIERSLGGGPRRPGPGEARPPVAMVASVDALLAKSASNVPGFVADVVNFPDEPGKPLVVRGNGADANPFLGKFTSSVEFDAQSGDVTKVFRAGEADVEYKVEHVFEELHFGRFGGVATKVLYFVLALCMTVVTATGLLVWWVKR